MVLLGPTGTGKSETALLLAERLQGEVVGCDALQIYRGFDTATAKPSSADRLRAVHHLVDVADPTEPYSLGDYVRHADAAIAGIVARGRVPIVAGGTGMYLRGLLRGIVDAPRIDPALRRRVRSMAQRWGAARLHRLLRRLDPVSAARLPAGDVQRVTRALELALCGGSTWSDALRRQGTWAGEGERYPTAKFGLDLPQPALAARLDARVDGFFEAGLVAEVRRLLDQGVPPEANAFKAIGYREVLSALRQGKDPDTVVEEVRRSTRRYAKRQRTWFRREPDVTWLDASEGPAAIAHRIVVTVGWGS